MLLNEIANGTVIPTDYNRKITIDGITESYQVYQIRLDKLYYNDQNDRIATWISKYKSENKIEKMNVDSEDYNDIIGSFIYDSNPKAIDKTLKNISFVGQREPGVVLNDGRIIDGNRRFTCLRMIEEREHKPKYFEAVILKQDIESNEKAIKVLELSIQHGEESKVDYNPIDKLVGIYNDIIKNEILTVEEYATTVNEKPHAIRKKMEQAMLMVDFLEFINAKEEFYIARDLELDGPLVEMQSILNKVNDDGEKDSLKNVIFSNLLMKPQGDITRFVRKIKHVIDSDHHEDFIEEQEEIAMAVLEKVVDVDKIDSQFINKNVRSDEELKRKMKSSVEKFELKAKRDSSRIKPIDDLKRCNELIASIDMRIVETLDDNEMSEFRQLMMDCEAAINRLKESLA